MATDTAAPLPSATTPAQAGRRRPQHLPQLDGIRGYACLGVIVAHYLGRWEWMSNLSVLVFFVLSSFLVTAILLDNADRAASGGGAPLVNFFVRRCLRLWPAYYAALLAALVLDAPGMRATALWHAAYLTNFYLGLVDRWSPEAAEPWWSLAIEQQFYLVWPLVVVVTPRRWLVPAILAICAWGFAMRAQIPVERVAFWTSPFGAFSAFAAGGILACLSQRRPVHPLWLLGVLPAAWLAREGLGLPASAAVTLYQSCVAVLAAALIAVACRDWAGPMRWVFANPPVLYLGRISYGVYVYHNLVASVLGEWLPLVGHQGLMRLLVDAPVTIALASLSWHALEQPVNAFKRHFPYPGPRARSDAAHLPARDSSRVSTRPATAPSTASSSSP